MAISTSENDESAQECVEIIIKPQSNKCENVSLGKGPSRFGPVREFCLLDLSQKDVALQQTIRQLRQEWEELRGQSASLFSDEFLLRVLNYRSGNVKNASRFLRRMSSTDVRFLQTSVQQLEEQLQSETLFPLPQGIRARQCKGKNIDSFFYMKPSGYRPSRTPTSTIVANLVYSMETLYERHRDYDNHKIGFIANMKDWTMGHFSIDYCQSFMRALQGIQTPVQADLFLIVDPPPWFGRVWSIMKPMLGITFVRKVHMISHGELPEFLEPGYEDCLPNDVRGGKCSARELVQDFITYRRHVESTVVPRQQGLPEWSTRRRTGRRGDARAPPQTPSDSSVPRKRRFRRHPQEHEDSEPCDILSETMYGSTDISSEGGFGRGPSSRHLTRCNSNDSNALSIDSAPVLPRRR